MVKCLECGREHDRYNGWTNKDANYCSNACKQKAYRKRKALHYDHNVTK